MVSFDSQESEVPQVAHCGGQVACQVVAAEITGEGMDGREKEGGGGREEERERECRSQEEGGMGDYKSDDGGGGLWGGIRMSLRRA